MEHRYTVKEIDELRAATRNRLNYGNANGNWVPPEETFRVFYPASNQTVEEHVRTYMLAGITAQNLKDADKPWPPVASEKIIMYTK